MILNGLPWKVRDRSVIFENAPKYHILDSFVYYEGYSISSKGFLPTVVDIRIIWIKFSLSVHFSSPWCKELIHLKRPWCWEKLRAGGKGDNRGWDGWMASPTRWRWVWVNSRNWWWTGRPSVLQSVGSQSRTWLNWTELNWKDSLSRNFILPSKTESRSLYICSFMQKSLMTQLSIYLQTGQGWSKKRNSSIEKNRE